MASGRGARVRSVATLVALFIVMEAVTLLFSAHTSASNSQVRCSSILAEAAISLPTPIKGNPSRIWEAQFEALQRAKARQLGCT